MTVNLRDYQQAAVAAATSHLRHGGRAQIRAACGTGKTLTTIAAAAGLTPPTGLIVVAAPSLALISQLLHGWATDGPPHAALTVCGDPTVRDAVAHIEDIPGETTTDPTRIADWVQRTPGLRLILTTHRSATIVGDGLRRAVAVADVLVVDEAHHLAGRRDKRNAVIHRDDAFPALRRLYATATPRVSIRGDDEALSMDDEAVFGPVAHAYPFASAIAEGWLDDYRVAVVGVSRPEVLSLLRGVDPAGDAVGGRLRMVAVQAALTRAAAELGLRRVITFTPRIDTSRRFTESLPDVVDAHPAAPDAKLTAWHVDGGMNQRQRAQALADLADPPGGGWTVVSNAKCLGEGVNIPAVDGVVFTEPKRSQVDVMQAVGRALRRSPGGGGVATILVPILLPDDPAHEPSGDDERQWETLWQVLRSMRAHDSTLAIDLDRVAAARVPGEPAGELPDRVVVDLPAGFSTPEWLDSIRVRVIEGGAAWWAEGLAHARAYHAEHGHLDVPQAWRSPDGFRLGQWLNDRRRLGCPDYLRAELDVLGLRWDAIRDIGGERKADAVLAYHREHGHFRIPEGFIQDGVNIQVATRGIRLAAAAGTLHPDVHARLDRAGFPWDPHAERFDAGLSRLREYAEANGSIDIPKTFVTDDGFQLGGWLDDKRQAWRRGRLADERIAALEELGVKVGNRHDARWDANLRALAEYITEHGKTPAESLNGVGVWLSKQRRTRAKGNLSPDRARRLDEVLAAVSEPTLIDRVVGVLAQSSVPLRPADVAQRLGADQEKAAASIRHAAAAGRITRVDRGLYIGVTSVTSTDPPTGTRDTRDSSDTHQVDPYADIPPGENDPDPGGT